MHIHTLPILTDNYAYIIQSGDMVGVIDPGESAPIIDFLNDNNLRPNWVINTHKHWDHINGNADIITTFGAKLAAPMECGTSDFVLKDGETFPFGEIEFQIIETVGHTKEHVVLFEPSEKILFSGDTLFAMGCGRLFEGTPDDMFTAMQRIKTLPADTKIYCGHEYTLSNAKFATHILPQNKDIKTRLKIIKGQSCTIPSTLAEELKTNPFLLAQTLGEFAQYRTAKDNF